MAKDHTDKVAPKSDVAAAVRQTAEDRAQDGAEEGFIPNYHGYTEAQIKIMEDARYDDSGPPPVDDGLDAKREEAEKARLETEKKAEKKAGWS
jgi:hypothetical protein